MMAQRDPIFVFSSSWRSGSTLLQRYITSSREVFVWGETGGALNSIAEAVAGWQQISGPASSRYTKGRGGNGEAAYRAVLAASSDEHPHMWIANVTPPLSEIVEKLRDWFNAFYGARAMELGYPRFGFKETRCDADTARLLQMIFPEAKFLFLVRNPFHVMESIKRRNWMGMTAGRETLAFYAEHWRHTSEQFRQAEFGMKIRYEDFVSDKSLQSQVMEFLDIDRRPPSDFIAKSQVDWKPDNASALDLWEKWQTRRHLGREMKNWGY